MFHVKKATILQLTVVLWLGYVFSSAFFKSPLICRFARAVFAYSSHFLLGLAVFFVRISTTFPLGSRLLIWPFLPFPLPPAIFSTRSVCTSYAKSTGVAPTGRSITSPFGV